MRGLNLLRDAAFVVALSVILSLGFNALRSDGIPLVAQEPYRILVPCPEPGGDVTALDPSAVAWGGRADLVVDSRTAAEASAWSAPGARNIPFDFLDPVSDAVLADLVATRVERVVVFGDGGQPDSGEELAKELSGRGVRNVCFVPGGANAVRAHLGAAEVNP